jgi:ABC-type Fe3+-siderophore transport system permease subunit
MDRWQDFDIAYFNECCAAIRHYSNLRFLILPIFVSLNAIFAFLLSKKNIVDPSNVHFTAVAVSSFFIFLEAFLDLYIRRFVNYARKNHPTSHISVLPSWRQAVPIIMIFIYLSFAVFWLQELFEIVNLNDDSCFIVFD